MTIDVVTHVAWMFVLFSSAAAAACAVGVLVRQRAHR